MDATFYDNKCRQIRAGIVEAIGTLGVGHIGGCLSVVEALVALYYGEMKIDPKNPKMEERDRFILSKGHGGPALYTVLADKGYFDRSLLATLNRSGTNLPSHCDMHRTPGIDMTTGSLGQGFSCAVGQAIGSQIVGDGVTIYALIGDGESQEGQVWEAALLAAHKKLDNLIAFTDFNNAQIDGSTDVVEGIRPLDKKWEAFGWNAMTVDGHDVLAIRQAVQKAKQRNGKPTMILLETVKGKGVGFAEKAGIGSHNMPVSKQQMEEALESLSQEGKQ